MRSDMITKLRNHPTPRVRLLPLDEQRRRVRLELPDPRKGDAGAVILAMVAVLLLVAAGLLALWLLQQGGRVAGRLAA